MEKHSSIFETLKELQKLSPESCDHKLAKFLASAENSALVEIDEVDSKAASDCYQSVMAEVFPYLYEQSL